MKDLISPTYRRRRQRTIALVLTLIACFTMLILGFTLFFNQPQSVSFSLSSSQTPVLQQISLAPPSEQKTLEVASSSQDSEKISSLLVLQEQNRMQSSKLEAFQSQLTEQNRLIEELQNRLQGAKRSDEVVLNATKSSAVRPSALQVTAVPSPAVLSSDKKIHLVAQGENLSTISQRYYGSAHRWRDIYEANRGSIPNQNQIKVGTPLVIP